MDLRSYQSAASETDCLPAGRSIDLMVPLLGLAGEVGELQSEYKKALRDGDAPGLFRGRPRLVDQISARAAMGACR